MKLIDRCATCKYLEENYELPSDGGYWYSCKKDVRTNGYGEIENPQEFGCIFYFRLDDENSKNS